MKILEAWSEDYLKWVRFFPLQIPVIIVEELDNRPLEELPDMVYGKMCIGVCGHNPVWMYHTLPKTNVRYRETKTV